MLTNRAWKRITVSLRSPILRGEYQTRRMATYFSWEMGRLATLRKLSSPRNHPQKLNTAFGRRRRRGQGNCGFAEEERAFQKLDATAGVHHVVAQRICGGHRPGAARAAPGAAHCAAPIGSVFSDPGHCSAPPRVQRDIYLVTRGPTLLKSCHKPIPHGGVSRAIIDFGNIILRVGAVVSHTPGTHDRTS